MIYQTGTITTTAGQTKIKGTGTRWKDNLAGISEGCPISYLINNVVYMNTVLSVNSDTEINLTYPVPVAASAAKYQIATFVLDSMSDGVRKIAANQLYIEYFLRNMDTWMTQDGIVEVKTPTGEIVKLESIRALKSLIDAKLDNSALDGYATTESVNSALDGKFDKKGGVVTGPTTFNHTNIRVSGTNDWTSLRLIRQDGSYVMFQTNPATDGSMATIVNRDKDEKTLGIVSIPNKTGTAMLAGDYGFGGTGQYRGGNGDVDFFNIVKERKTQVFRTNTSTTYQYAFGPTFLISTGDAWASFCIQPSSGNVIVGGGVEGQYNNKNILYGTANTTKDANGNLKAASPVIKVYSDHVELNDESEGVEMEHLGVGHYLIKGVIGFNADGAWGVNNGFVIPQDHNGKNMVLIDYEVRPDGDIEVFVFHQQNADMPERFQNKRIKYFDEEGAPVYFENYEPCDVPESRWIDMRVEMPPNSIYNQKLAEAERLAKIEAERVAKEETEKAAREEAERLEEESKQEQASKLEE